jgi:hypothetical protein
VRAAIRIILEALDTRGHAVLFAPEIDYAIALPMSAASMTGRDAPFVVAPA